MAAVAIAACHDAAAPSDGPSIRIVPVAGSVFEGDVVHLTAQVVDASGAEIPDAPVT